MLPVTLRFLNFLTTNLIKVSIEDFTLKLPHPANFTLHKLIIFQRRAREEKAIKDRSTAIQIIRAIMAKGERETLRNTFLNIPTKWQKKVLDGLDKLDDREIIEALK
ncbi:MAG: GSU2403 family nucleotidyltransferase fold protein [Candidatus Omnitrophota bacterium]